MICRIALGAARHELTPVDNWFIADYLPSAKGQYVQVYLYGLMQCYHPSMCGVSIPDALGLSEDAVTEAFVYWQSQGLVRITSEKPLTVEYRLSERPGGDDAVPLKYHSLVQSLSTLTAPRQFGMRELRQVYDWIEVYHLEEGAVLELVSYCLTQKPGCGVNYMSAVARSFAEVGVKSQEDAKAYIESCTLRMSGAAAVLRQWNKRRKPTMDELARYDKWTREWGFTDEAILAALPRLTVSGSPNFEYLDELLEDLHGQGVATAADMQANEEKGTLEKDFAKLLFSRAGKAEPATRTQRKQIAMYLDGFAMPRELLLFAAEKSRGATEPFGMMKKLLNEWHEKEISTIAGAEAYENERKSRPAAAPKKAVSHGYAQHNVSDAELDALLVDLDQDLPS